MPMHNLLECSDNYSMTSGSLRNYYRDKIVDVDDNASNDLSNKHNRKKTTPHHLEIKKMLINHHNHQCILI